MSEPNLVWIDLEMTGLNPQADRIIEIATVVTDADLNSLGRGPVLAVHQSEAVLSGMDNWNQTTHSGTGLISRVRASAVTESEAETATLDFLRDHVKPGVSPLCGNSICQDRRFLAQHMPRLESFLHYRNLDVSSIKELAIRWRPGLADGFVKQGGHRALDDILESIEELKYYREHFFRTDLPS
ncbi:MAG TPA: oligoribonuclease [Gammaproteobacteria bacterium]|nr:oligoribonuclease [Gammaproteobacteria bacterium]|tara:strand:- start:279 stop:830 length:552 start_codon:yes stop_codon:yes gene_type:complete